MYPHTVHVCAATIRPVMVSPARPPLRNVFDLDALMCPGGETMHFYSVYAEPGIQEALAAEQIREVHLAPLDSPAPMSRMLGVDSLWVLDQVVTAEGKVVTAMPKVLQRARFKRVALGLGLVATAFAAGFVGHGAVAVVVALLGSSILSSGLRFPKQLDSGTEGA